MTEGWIKLHRKLSEDPQWLKEPFTRGQAWVDLLMLANHDKGYIRVRGNRLDVLRGQVGWSEQALSRRWQWSRSRVRKFLSELEKLEHQIEQQKNNISSIITIVNYESYQTKNSRKDSRETAERPQKDTNKNDKNEKNIITPPFFEDFWKAYPRKIGKTQASKSWEKISISEEVYHQIMAGLDNYIKYEWKGKEMKYIPHAATWLNQERWKDEVTIKKEDSDFL